VKQYCFLLLLQVFFFLNFTGHPPGPEEAVLPHLAFPRTQSRRGLYRSTFTRHRGPLCRHLHQTTKTFWTIYIATDDKTTTKLLDCLGSRSLIYVSE